MMKTSLSEVKNAMLIASALVLMSQAALSEGVEARSSESSEVRVVARRLPAETPAAVKIEADLKSHIEALDRKLAEELAKRRAAIAAQPIELVITEVHTRG